MADLAPGYPRNILDEDKQGVLGRPLPRVEGALKVCGRARYAYEYAGHGKAAYGVIVGATIANGRITAVKTSDAERLPGVLLVMTHLTAPQQADYVTFDELPSPFASYSVARPFLFDDKVRYYGEPVALVVAETFETARNAAALVDVQYIEGATPVSRVKSVAAQAFAPKTVRGFIETDRPKATSRPPLRPHR